MSAALTARRGVTAPRGFAASAVSAGIRKSGRPDTALVVSDRPARAAALFTCNQFAAAPVMLSREHLRRSRTHRALLFNSGSANACTGAPGLADARRLCAAAARAVGCRSEQVLPASTGIIGTRLPVSRIEVVLPQAASKATPAGGQDAARAIMTTDTVPKLVETTLTLNQTKVTLGGMAKGSGMIHPNMATLLAAVTTDVDPAGLNLRALLRQAAAGTFNAISVDGETSTNDTLFFLANGAAGRGRLSGAAVRKFQEGLTTVLDALAEAIVRDGEGAGKMIDVVVEGARNDAEAMIAARAVGDSSLVKTAVHGHDANWGRILQSLGATTVALDPGKVRVNLNGVPLVRRGRDAGTSWDRANGALKPATVVIAIHLGRGRGRARYRTCDLTAKYVAINAGYRS